MFGHQTFTCTINDKHDALKEKMDVIQTFLNKKKKEAKRKGFKLKKIFAVTTGDATINEITLFYDIVRKK